MEIKLIRTPLGLSPFGDESYDLIRALPYDTILTAKIQESRNPQFHKKYMAFFRIAWEYQNEDTQSWFGSVRNFRKTIEVAAGHCDKVYNLELQSWVDIPRSVAYDELEQSEFEDLYERVKQIVFTQFLPEDVEDDFYEATKDF
jgi:hypothetical protein